MSQSKPKVTRTYGPIHFEDLDAHRFEDLIRELIYDYKNWQTIEATGRSGSDDGFDIRAYEKPEMRSVSDEDDGGQIEQPSPMEGNIWMIQGKREKEIGPKKIENILSEIDTKNPPYGYILAASANFSKKSYDVFREKLKDKGVMEFYLWGKAELEGMLHFPKNDRILFTFFGISLAKERRSRTTEVRSIIVNKNKIFRIFGDNHHITERRALIRDLGDIYYPYKYEYSDFDKKPRWKEYILESYHPLGIWFQGHKFFAYIDREKKEWDFTRLAELSPGYGESPEERDERQQKQKDVEDMWNFLSHEKKAYFFINYLLYFKDIAAVDEKGDIIHQYPHLHANFSGKLGPFGNTSNSLRPKDEAEVELDDYTKIDFFPKEFPSAKPGVIRVDPIKIDKKNSNSIRYQDKDVLYDIDGRYSMLSVKDHYPVIIGDELSEFYFQITNKFSMTCGDYLKKVGGVRVKMDIDQQIGREVNSDEILNIIEFKKDYDFQLRRANPPEISK